MASACRNALQGFRIHKDLPNFFMHPTLGALFDVSINTTSNILKPFHCLLPHIAGVACAPSTPPSDRINHSLMLVSPKSAHSRLKLHINDYLSHSLYNEVFSNAPDHFHLLPSLLSSRTSYHLIGLCRSNPHNHLLNWQFDTSIKCKLRLPLHPTTNQPICACGTVVNIFGDHIFKCTCICKIGVHNTICNGFVQSLAPVLSTTKYVPPNTTVDTEPILYLPSDPHSCPFNLSFDPYPASPPLTSHGCTSTTVGADITISSLPPKLSIIPSSPDVQQIITANANSHLQKCKCRKLGRINKTDTSTSIITRGGTLIGDLLHRNMLLIPFAIDPLGRFGPLLQHFLFGHHSALLLWFPPSRPNATQMYTKLLQYPSLKGILLLTNHNWVLHPTQHFYGHSYLAPTPSITTVQSLGVSLTKAFAHHVQYAS